MNTSSPSKTQLFQYSFLALPLAFAGLPLYINAPDFYIREFGISIGAIGYVLLIIRLFDALQDPIIGFVSDKYHKHRYLIMTAGVFILSLGMCGIFYGPLFETNIMTWFIVSMLLATTGFSICSINLNQIGSFWKKEPDKRTLIAAWRESFSLLGLLLAALLPALLQLKFPSNISYEFISQIFLFLIFIGFSLFLSFLFDMKSLDNKNIDSSINFQFIRLFKGTNSLFFLVCFLSQLASSLPAVLVLFFIRDYLQLESFTGLFLFLYFTSGIAFISVWVKISRKLGKMTTWLISMILSVMVFCWVFTLSPGNSIFYGFICVLSGIALGADLALPPSILADRVTRQNSESISTQYFAAFGFIPKLTISIASGIAFITLDTIGFTTESINSESALFGLLVLYSLLPCFLKILALITLYIMQNKEGDDYANYERGYRDGNFNIS